MLKIIPYSVNSGLENMKTDSDLLDYAIENKLNYPIFRLYGWKPACVSLGRNQDDKFLDLSLLKKRGVDVVRRLTGGRALLHDDEITYSYVCPVSFLENGESVSASYKEICMFLTDKFKSLGIELDFGEKRVSTKFDYCMMVSTGADLCYEGKKLIGSAQCRKHGYILQHGSILYDYNEELLKEIFGESFNKDEITSIKKINPNISKKDIINILSNT